MTALSGASVMSATQTPSAQAASAERALPTSYIPSRKRAPPRALLTLDVDAKILPAHMPDLTVPIQNQIKAAITGPSGVIAIEASTALDRKGAYGPFRARLANCANSATTIVFAGSSTTAGHTTVAANRWVNLLAARSTANPVRTLAEVKVASPLPFGIHCAGSLPAQFQPPTLVPTSVDQPEVFVATFAHVGVSP